MKIEIHLPTKEEAVAAWQAQHPDQAGTERQQDVSLAFLQQLLVEKIAKADFNPEADKLVLVVKDEVPGVAGLEVPMGGKAFDTTPQLVREKFYLNNAIKSILVRNNLPDLEQIYLLSQIQTIILALQVISDGAELRIDRSSASSPAKSSNS